MISSRNVWLPVALALAMLLVACGGDSNDGDEAASANAPAAEAGIERNYAAAPPMTIDVSHRFEAVLLTEGGEIRIELLPVYAPGYVNNFVFLARNDFYDGLTFHRVIAGFMAQGGDPEGQGFGGPGYDLVEEKNELEFGVGVLSMAKGAQVSGSQFFITLAATPFLEGDFTVFGQVIEGLDVLQQITVREPGPDAPLAAHIIDIEIIETP